MRLQVHDLIEATRGRLMIGGAAAPTEILTGVTTDSRLAVPGGVFVALRGPHADGHHFALDAFERGASLAVVSDERTAAAVVARGGAALVVADTLRALGAIAAVHRRTLAVTVIGVTGSVGKTTTVAMCARILEGQLTTARSAESWNAEIGVALALLGLRPEHQVAVIEMAMRGPGQIRELAEMARPRIGAVTNVTDTHLELLGSRATIAAAKAELLEGLPADGVAVVDADDPWTPRLVRDVRCRIVRCGIQKADVRAEAVRAVAEGTRFHLVIGSQRAEVDLPLVGSHQVRNALIAAGLAWAVGVPIDAVAAGLARATPLKMRQQLLEVDGVLVIDDTYNASPQSMAAAFETVERLGGARRRVMALGEMLELGPASADMHRDVGRLAAALGPALLVAVGPHAAAYLDGARAAGLPESACAWVAQPEEAGPIVRRTLRAGDVLLVKGSRGIGMERLVEILSGRPAVKTS